MIHDTRDYLLHTHTHTYTHTHTHTHTKLRMVYVHTHTHTHTQHTITHGMCTHVGMHMCTQYRYMYCV